MAVRNHLSRHFREQKQKMRCISAHCPLSLSKNMSRLSEQAKKKLFAVRTNHASMSVSFLAYIMSILCFATEYRLISMHQKLYVDEEVLDSRQFSESKQFRKCGCIEGITIKIACEKKCSKERKKLELEMLQRSFYTCVLDCNSKKSTTFFFKTSTVDVRYFDDVVVFGRLIYQYRNLRLFAVEEMRHL